MKYAFVTVSIIAVWIATILVVWSLGTDAILLPVIAIFMSVVLFMIGFRKK